MVLLKCVKSYWYDRVIVLPALTVPGVMVVPVRIYRAVNILAKVFPLKDIVPKVCLPVVESEGPNITALLLSIICTEIPVAVSLVCVSFKFEVVLSGELMSVIM